MSMFRLGGRLRGFFGGDFFFWGGGGGGGVKGNL